MEKRVGLALLGLCVAMLSLLGCGVFHRPTCKEQLGDYLPQFDQIMDRWVVAVEDGRQTPRLQIATIISELRDLQYEMEDLAYPECAESLRWSALKVIKQSIVFYTAFRDQASDETLVSELNEMVDLTAEWKRAREVIYEQ